MLLLTYHQSLETPATQIRQRLERNGSSGAVMPPPPVRTYGVPIPLLNLVMSPQICLVNFLFVDTLHKTDCEINN